MADTCGECEMWRRECETVRDPGRGSPRIYALGQCLVHTALSASVPRTWQDNGACPAFKRKADAAERSVRRIQADIGDSRWRGATPAEWAVHCADVIREEIAKDKEAR